FARVLAEIGRFLDAQHARYGLAGAFALQAHGLQRATSDLDLIVEARAQPALLAHLDSLGYERLHVSEGYSNHLHPDPAWGRIDFIYLDDRTSELIFAEASATRVLPGVEMLAPSAEHIAAMKVHAMKNDRSRTLKEMADIQFLLQLPGVDQAQIRRYFDEAGLSERFDEIEALASDRDPGDGR
ncbi:MAG: hypothetical protein ACJ78U_16845, partial [Myxococcales bacterium]